MTERTAPSSTSPAGTQANKQALFDAAVEVMRAQAEQQEAEESRRRRDQGRFSPVVATALTIALAAAAYVAIERPTWIFPEAPPAESQEIREASLRIGMATTAQRIERFRMAQGRLPRTLSESGSSATGILYEPRAGNQYVLRGANGPVRLTLSSSDSLRAFVGQSFQAISQRARR